MQPFRSQREHAAQMRAELQSTVSKFALFMPAMALAPGVFVCGYFLSESSTYSSGAIGALIAGVVPIGLIGASLAVQWIGLRLIPRQTKTSRKSMRAPFLALALVVGGMNVYAGIMFAGMPAARAAAERFMIFLD